MGDKNKHKKWYVYLYGNPLSPENYQVINVAPRCGNGRNICAVYADGYEDQPFEFSNKLKAHIANAIATGAAQPIGGNPYVVVLKP
jgi:hypothetical protein